MDRHFVNTFAAFIPLGPNQAEVDRAEDLIESLLFHEQFTSHVVVVEDGQHDISRLEKMPFPNSCGLTVLPHPRPYDNLNSLGGLCAADLTALSYIYKHLPVRFVLKLDTDSLIIAPFSLKLFALLDSRADIGIIGTLGDSCNRSVRSFEMEPQVVAMIHTALDLGLSKDKFSPEALIALERWGVKTTHERRAFRFLCRLMEPLLSSPFGGEHCQGGAYAISQGLISFLATSGFLSNPSLWLNLKFGEDQMMGALCALACLVALDYSDYCEPFGIQAKGLAFPPQVLLEHGYSIIHSVKGDPDYSENYIRRFFQHLRQK